MSHNNCILTLLDLKDNAGDLIQFDLMNDASAN